MRDRKSRCRSLAENRMKIRPVEVEIIGLTENVKKERNNKIQDAKHMAFPVTTITRWPKRGFTKSFQIM